MWDIAIDVLEPPAQGNLTRHPSKKQQMSKNNGVKQLAEPPDLFPRMHTHPADVRLCSCSIINDAVNKVTIRGWRNTTRHGSRTYRVDLYRLFDRINLDPGIQVKCVYTKQQIADIPAKGSFSRERWPSATTKRADKLVCEHGRVIPCKYCWRQLHATAK